jgi:hypothetical protein
MGSYAGVDYNSLYLTVNSEVIYSHYKGKGMKWGRLEWGRRIRLRVTKV